MKKLLQKFLPTKKSFLGIDIGTNEIKAVELKRVKDEVEITKIGKVETPPNAINDGKIINLEALTATLRKLMAQQNFETKEVFLVVNGNSVITRQIPMPIMEEKDIYAALKYEAERYIPIPVADLFIDYIIIGEEETEEGSNYNLLLVAVPQQIIYQYYDLLVGAGLVPIAVEIIPTALSRLFSLYHNSKPYDYNGANVIVDIGTNLTNLVIFKDGRIDFTRSIPIGGQHITESVAQTFLLSFEEAEIFKKQSSRILFENSKGEFVGGNAIQLDLALRSGLAGLIDEIQRSIEFYKLNNKNRSLSSEELINKVFLIGGTAKINGLVELFEAEFNISFANLDKKLLVENKSVVFKNDTWDKLDTSYLPALGLALRKVVQ